MVESRDLPAIETAAPLRAGQCALAVSLVVRGAPQAYCAMICPRAR